MKRKTILSLCVIGIMAMPMLTLTSCNKDVKAAEAETVEAEAVEAELAANEPAELSLNESGVLLAKGDSLQLKAVAGSATAYSSSNEAVATVDNSGKVTAVGKGNAVITATDGTLEATCGVIVDLDETALIDIRTTEPKMILSEQYLYHATVFRDLVTVNGEHYYIQRNDSTPSDLTIQHLDENGYVDEWMTFIGFGGGVSISAEVMDDGSWYLWLESNGNAASEGQTLSRIKYEPGKTYQGQGGQTWAFKKAEGAVYASVDQENGLVCVRTVSTGGYTFTYYDYESMIAGEPLVPLYEIELNMLTATLSRDINPTGAGVGEHNFRGFAVSGQYIYQYFGTAKSSILVAVYNMAGEAQYVHAVTQFKDLVFREPDGINIADGKIYLGIVSGESADRRVNILYYE